MWLRATGSTAVSQLLDSFVVLYVAFVLGPQRWPVSQFLAVGTVNYLYGLPEWAVSVAAEIDGIVVDLMAALRESVDDRRSLTPEPGGP